MLPPASIQTRLPVDAHGCDHLSLRFATTPKQASEDASRRDRELLVLPLLPASHTLSDELRRFTRRLVLAVTAPRPSTPAEGAPAAASTSAPSTSSAAVGSGAQLPRSAAAAASLASTRSSQPRGWPLSSEDDWDEILAASRRGEWLDADDVSEDGSFESLNLDQFEWGELLEEQRRDGSGRLQGMRDERRQRRDELRREERSMRREARSLRRAQQERRAAEADVPGERRLRPDAAVRQAGPGCVVVRSMRCPMGSTLGCARWCSPAALGVAGHVLDTLGAVAPRCAVATLAGHSAVDGAQSRGPQHRENAQPGLMVPPRTPAPRAAQRAWRGHGRGDARCSGGGPWPGL
jgi:hypothetical protein